MSKLAAFFRDSSTWLGVFYPNHYLTAMFPSFQDAEEARGRLMQCGISRSNVVTATGEDVIEYADEHVWTDGLRGWIFRGISRALGTEAANADADVKLARRGGAFLAVYCATDRDKRGAWTCLAPAHPIAARHYGAGGIDHLVGR
jgi:hypothetical protein